MDTNNEVVENTQQNNTQVSETTHKSFEDILKEEPSYQAEFDRRNQKALNTARTNWEREQAEKESEAQKLSKMKEDERKNYEVEKARKEKEDALAELNAYKLKEEAEKIASNPESKLDISLLNLIDFKTIKAEQVETTIKNIKKVFDDAVENEINLRLREKTPKTVVNQNGETAKSIPNVF